MEATIIGQGVNDLPDVDPVEVARDKLTASADFRPEEILVQVLKRPSDPVTRRLQEALHFWTAAGLAVQPLEDPFGGWIDVSRNWQTLLFLRAKRFKFALLVDTDVGPPIETPFLLARHNLPVVSGCVPGYNKDRGLFLCIAVKGPDGKARFPALMHGKVVQSVPARGLAEIHNAGAGCIMIRRDVLEALWKRYEDEKRQEGVGREVDMMVLEASGNGGRIELTDAMRQAVRQRITRSNYEDDLTGPPFSISQSVRDRSAEKGIMLKGEDISFTDRVRAAGFKLYADFEVRCVHDKLMCLGWPQEALAKDLSVEDWRVTAFDNPVEQE